jgi:predicted dienelactone hydrolase
MRKPIAAGLVAAALCLGTAQAAEPAHPSAFKVGIVARRFVPAEPYDWRGDANHALTVMIWYPAEPGAHEQDQMIGAPGRPLFDGGKAAPDAALSPAPGRFPLIVLSHGTGATASSLAWLGVALSSAGYVVAAVNHPGNNAIDGYTVEGFSLWWLRARDLGAVIDGMLADKMFGPRLDWQRIGAAGFSLGGYTVVAAAGGITSLVHFRAFCASPSADRMCVPPPEFADLAAKAETLAKTDPVFAAALADHGGSYRDRRVRAVFAMAPALVPAFVPQSLARIDAPMAIVAGVGDAIVPVASGARFLAAHVMGSELTILPGDAGHYVFVASCTDAGRASLPELCADAPGVDRDAIHRETARLAVAFFDRELR